MVAYGNEVENDWKVSLIYKKKNRTYSRKNVDLLILLQPMSVVHLLCGY